MGVDPNTLPARYRDQVMRQLAPQAQEPVILPRSAFVDFAPVSEETKLNKLERAWLSELRTKLPWASIHIQAITLKLAHDCRYTPDFMVVTQEGRIEFHETKGPQFWDDAKVKLKVAARLFRWASFHLVRKKGINGWDIEEVKP